MEWAPMETVRLSTTPCQKVSTAVRKAWVSGDLGQALVAQDLGYLRIGVQAGQLVLAGGQRLEEGTVGQATGLAKIAVLPGQLIEAGEGLVQTSVLAGQHGLKILFVDIVCQVAPPVGQAQDHDAGHFGGALGLEGLPAVQQAGEELVQVVEGHPGAQQVEGLGLHLALPQVPEELGAVRHTAQEAVARGLLALEQAGQHAGGALQEGPGLQTLPVGRQSGQVVAADVAIQTHGLPVGVWIRLGRQTCLASVRGQETIGIQTQQVVCAGLLRIGVDAAGGQTDLGWVEADIRPRAVLHGLGLMACVGHGYSLQCRSDWPALAESSAVLLIIVALHILSIPAMPPCGAKAVWRKNMGGPIALGELGPPVWSGGVWG